MFSSAPCVDTCTQVGLESAPSRGHWCLEDPILFLDGVVPLSILRSHVSDARFNFCPLSESTNSSTATLKAWVRHLERIENEISTSKCLVSNIHALTWPFRRDSRTDTGGSISRRTSRIATLRPPGNVDKCLRVLPRQSSHASCVGLLPAVGKDRCSINPYESLDGFSSPLRGLHDWSLLGLNDGDSHGSDGDSWDLLGLYQLDSICAHQHYNLSTHSGNTFE